MKKILLATLLFLYNFCYAQMKHDYVWLFGYAPSPGFPDPLLGGSEVDFNQNPPLVSFFDIPFDFLAIAMISDVEGKLQFYTNACQIVNRKHQVMSNGDGINPGVYHDAYCSKGYPLSQGVLALPFPDSSNHYILLHYRKEDTGEKKNLMYTIINMNTLDSLGKVEGKNKLIITDYMADLLTAVRHANGRDWWIVAPKTDSEEGYLFLLTPKGMEGPVIRKFGQYWDYNGANGQAVFSPDGTKYARMNRINDLHIANFNRCTGEFTKGIKITFPGDTIISSGAAFSPNSRYLYISATRKVYQFDTWAGNIGTTKQTVAVYDGFQSPFSTYFFQLMLAPDGKIYITTPNSNNVLHVIHNPDGGGAACNFEQHGLILPTLHAFMTPNFPHFRLYDLPGSPCDTLGIDGPVVSAPEPQPGAGVLRLYPNPAASGAGVTVALPPTAAGRLVLRDLTGRLWSEQAKAAGTERVELGTGGLPAGIYIVSFRSERGGVLNRKLVVQRQ